MESFERAVALEPRDGHLWLRLAYARYVRAGSVTPDVVAALEHAYLRLPYGEPDIRRWRLQFCDAHWASLSVGVRAAALREARSEQPRWRERNLSGPLAG